MAEDSFQFRLMRYIHEMVNMQILQDFESQKKAEVYFKVVILTVAVVISSTCRFLMLLGISFNSSLFVSIPLWLLWSSAIS